MKLVKCENLHYYDADKYEACPHCAKLNPAPRTATHNEDEKDDPATVKKAAPEDTKTESLWELNSEAQAAPASPERAAEAQEKAREISPPPPAPSAGSLAAAVKTASGEDCKTVAFYDVGGTEPVVGWLVCLKGEYIGESFNLKSGRNFIGRSLGMDVALVDEKTISRDKHCVVTFEPVKKLFLIQPGESNGLTYVNGEILMSFSELKNMDRIEMGTSVYLFVKLCGDDFSWDEYIK